MQQEPPWSPICPQRMWTPRWCNCTTPRRRVKTSRGSWDRRTTMSSSCSCRATNSNSEFNIWKTRFEDSNSIANSKNSRWNNRWWNTNPRWKLNLRRKLSGWKVGWAPLARTKAQRSCLISLEGTSNNLSSRIKAEED